MRRLAVCAALTALATPAPASAALPPIKHVFIIVLENKGYDTTFKKDSDAPYLARTLTAQGQLLTQYYAIGHSSLDNYIAFISGQGPNPQTQGDCPVFTEFAPGTIGPDGQAIGQGCVYPAPVKTLADQLAAKGLSWKGYMEDMGNSPTEPKTCRHPAIGDFDRTESAREGDQYAARHNPFVYFHSIIDDQATCDANVIPLDRLPGDLALAATTASYSFITPNLCNDGHDGPCVDGRPGKLKTANEFLESWVPRILASPGYREGGLLIVTFDEAGDDATACCGEEQGPNTPNNGGVNQGPGGGRTGAVLISQYVRPGSINDTPYNHYSLLRSTEDLFGLDHLGFAAQDGLKPFGDDVYNRPEGEPPAGVAPRPRIRLTVRPRRVPRGRLTRFRFRATVRASGVRSPVAGARIRLGHATARTGRRGRATIRYRFTGRVGVRHPTAARSGFRRGRARVRVVQSRLRETPKSIR